MIRPLRSKRQHQGSRSVEPEVFVTSRRRLGDVRTAPLLALVTSHVDHFRRAAVVPLLRATPSVPASITFAFKNEIMKRMEERIEPTRTCWSTSCLRRCLQLRTRTSVRQCASSRPLAATGSHSAPLLLSLTCSNANHTLTRLSSLSSSASVAVSPRVV